MPVVILNILRTVLFSPLTWLISIGVPKLWGLLKTILISGLNISGWFVLIIELGKKLLGIIGLGGAVVSGGATVSQIMHLLGSIGDPQGALLDYISSVINSGPYTLSSLVASLDSSLASLTSSSFNPAITFTYALQVTGVGECFDQILMSVIQNAVFIFSVFLVRWAFRQNFTFTKSVPTK